MSGRFLLLVLLAVGASAAREKCRAGAGAIYPHEKDCTKYFVCLGLYHQQMDCSDGNYFSKDIKICIKPSLSGCVNKICDSVVPEPHPTDCNKYVLCVLGAPKELSCKENWEFHPEWKTCVHPSMSTCSSGQSTTTQAATTTTTTTEAPTTTTEAATTTTTTTEAPTTTTEAAATTTEAAATTTEAAATTTTTTTEAPTTTTEAVATTTEAAATTTEAAATTTEAATTTTTTTTEAATTTTEAASSPSTTTQASVNSCPAVDGPMATILPHESDCTKFYMCSNGRPNLMSCPAGLHFNNILKVCDWPADAGCDASLSSTTTTSAPSTTPEPTPTTEAPVDVCSTSCINEYWADPLDCSAYWKCVGKQSVQSKCPSGLRFNTKLRTCDKSSSVSCKAFMRN